MAETSEPWGMVAMVEAVVLLSGGLDSSTALARTMEMGYEPVAITLDYGQRHRRELNSARSVARHFGVKEHIMVSIGIGEILGCSLTDRSMEVRHASSREEISEGVPNTYVPSRNTILLGIAASVAESRGSGAIVIAANSVDYSGYPDCTPEFIEAFQRVLDVGTKVGLAGRPIKVEAPLIRMSKAEIVREAVRLGVPLELTWSCYEGGDKACGKCDSCVLRREGFEKAGVRDPLEYEVS